MGTLRQQEAKIKKCLGCGYCCLKAMCALGTIRLGTYKDRCPYLRWNGRRYLCDLYLSDPKSLGEKMAIGAGCSSSLFNDWRKEVKYRG